MKSRSQESTAGGVAGEPEGARRASGGSPAAPGLVPPVPIESSEVEPRIGRRKFSASYKLQILQEAEACSAGEVGRLLRREGLYSSHLTKWRQQRDRGALLGLTPKPGRRPDPNTPALQRIRDLERENEQLRRRLYQAETIIEVQKKVSEILGIPLGPNGNNEKS